MGTSVIPCVEAASAVDEPMYYCGMCQDAVEADDAALAGCKHIFHRECIMQYATCAPAAGKKVTCPAGAYTRPLFSSSRAASDAQNHTTHHAHPLTPPSRVLHNPYAHPLAHKKLS
jgi:hypothetical protein